jgi:hypothetical protein
VTKASLDRRSCRSPERRKEPLHIGFVGPAMNQKDHAVGEKRVEDNVEVRRQGCVAQRVQDGGNDAPVGEEGLRLKCGQRDVVGLLAAVGEFRRNSPARAL